MFSSKPVLVSARRAPILCRYRTTYVSDVRTMTTCSPPPRLRRGCCGRKPCRGWWATRGIQPPRAGRCHVKASQAFTPSLSKEGTFLSAPFTYVALYSMLGSPRETSPAGCCLSPPSKAESLHFHLWWCRTAASTALLLLQLIGSFLPSECPS
jgi:hypothetical protein